jgi:cell division protein FtsQ
MAARPTRQPGARAAVIPFPAQGTLARHLRGVPTGRSLAIGGAIVAAVLLAYAVARYSPLFALDRVEVRGAPPALAARIAAALEPLHGESLLAFRAGQADERLGRIPEVAAASYDRAFPHTLRVTVKAERALAVIRRGDQAWLAAASGRVLRPLPIDRLGALPRIWVPKDTQVEVGSRLGDPHALVAVRALAPLERVGFPARVRFVRASAKELTLVLASHVELRLGDLDRLGLKLAVAARILPQVEVPPRGPPYLDLTVPERPVASSSTIPNPQVAG